MTDREFAGRLVRLRAREVPVAVLASWSRVWHGPSLLGWWAGQGVSPGAAAWAARRPARIGSERWWPPVTPSPQPLARLGRRSGPRTGTCGSPGPGTGPTRVRRSPAAPAGRWAAGAAGTPRRGRGTTGCASQRPSPRSAHARQGGLVRPRQRRSSGSCCRGGHPAACRTLDSAVSEMAAGQASTPVVPAGPRVGPPGPAASIPGVRERWSGSGGQGAVVRMRTWLAEPVHASSVNQGPG